MSLKSVNFPKLEVRMKSVVLFEVFTYFGQFFMSEGQFLSGHQEAQIAWSSVVFCVNIQFPSKPRDAGPLVAIEGYPGSGS